MRESSPPRLDDASSPDVVGPGLYRIVNLLLAIVLLVLLSPVFLVIAWMIWRIDGAPIMFGHYRVGQNGKLFRCLKFRSMVRDSEDVLARLLRENAAAREEWHRDRKLRNDPRITPIGRFLRNTSLDELPQLFNVVRGEMNLVGPRPIVVQELRYYGDSKQHYLAVKPGMTGLWQVSGRSETTYDERVAFDREYVDGHSLTLDMRILLRTARVVLRREGAR